ncbi:MAG: hypothetical protein M1831_000671 [Alyxoria varia]|nr:MAG: hypothetical protein M1831_000671 [Alyxoria varia]
MTHNWGQYSPYFNVSHFSSSPSEEIPDELRPECHRVDFVQIVSRHGARTPTGSKVSKIQDALERAKASIEASGLQAPGPAVEALRNYEYDLPTGQLTELGREQMEDSGAKARLRYGGLNSKPFVRATDRERVVESAQLWNKGFQGGRDRSDLAQYNPDVAIPEGTGLLNPLSHGACPEFEYKGGSSFRRQDPVLEEFGAIMKRNIEMKGSIKDADIISKWSIEDIVSIMELCAAETVLSQDNSISPLCELFGAGDWKLFNYYCTLTKYYKTGAGNPLGKAQGIGFVNELIARLKGERVVDQTTTNPDYDEPFDTFPTGVEHNFFADFTHDSDMTSILFVLNLYDESEDPKNLYPTNMNGPSTTIEKGYDPNYRHFAANVAVPLAARAYIERMQCTPPGSNSPESYIRILVNDRVMRQPHCSNKDGTSPELCREDDFIESLRWAREYGNWDQCFSAQFPRDARRGRSYPPMPRPPIRVHCPPDGCTEAIEAQTHDRPEAIGDFGPKSQETS